MPSFNYTDRRCRWLYFTGDSNVRNLLAIQHHAARRQLHEFRTALASPHHSEEGDGSVYQRGRQRTSGATCGTRWFDREYLYVTVHGVGHFPDASVIPPDSRLTLLRGTSGTSCRGTRPSDTSVARRQARAPA